ncbi:aldehyde dehydrogenase family protein [Candidatus Laterigemmans baculatus]|uniref:aldehyde dehydrogenase family protein n=1 Tax=Candidatus Laterigemmans baculatus TaxID=2770505 RepID=UPI0013DB67AB|nr:aldehyde dehydrogenase family protein [Candidatus Laterigemmans baculatus]
MLDSPLLPRLATSAASAYIGGSWFAVPGPRDLHVTNPADGRLLAELPMLGADEAERAIEAAAASAEQPSEDDRRAWLEGIAAGLTENRRELGRIISLENGKPWKEAEAEVDYAASFFRYAASHLERLRSHQLRERPRGHGWVVHYRPVGVAALIVPWNFPLAMTAKKLSAALAAGAPSVLKPATLTPLSSIALLEIIDSLGLPGGMVNLIVGDSRSIGRVFCEHPAVRSISFTGSTEVGRLLLRQAAPHIKRLTLELGGNAPFIVCGDADLDSAVEHLIQNKFRCAGQTCVCANRVYVDSAVASAFTDRLVRRVAKLNVGDGLQPETDLGPLINRAGFEKVRGHVEDALQRGARCEAGELPPEPTEEWGLFFPPTVLSGVPHDARCVAEETFGPLIPLIEFGSESQVLEWANGTEFGLAAYLFTADAERARRMIGRLHFGHAGYNSGTGPTAEAPFGGWKASGFGREGGREGLMEFVEPQTVPSST